MSMNPHEVKYFLAICISFRVATISVLSHNLLWIMLDFRCFALSILLAQFRFYFLQLDLLYSKAEQKGINKLINEKNLFLQQCFNIIFLTYNIYKFKNK